MTMLGRHVYRVTPSAEGAWTVRKDGDVGTHREGRNRREAFDLACELARRDEPSKVVVENGDGTIAEEQVFGIDDGLLSDDLGAKRPRS
jgi:hypothetical protein